MRKMNKAGNIQWFIVVFRICMYDRVTCIYRAGVRGECCFRVLIPVVTVTMQSLTSMLRDLF